MRHVRCRDGTLVWTNLVMSRAGATRETTRRVHDTMAIPKGAVPSELDKALSQDLVMVGEVSPDSEEVSVWL